MRFDMAGLRGVRVHPAGFLLIDARPTRTGTFRYRRPDGSVRAEYRPREEVCNSSPCPVMRQGHFKSERSQSCRSHLLTPRPGSLGTAGVGELSIR